MKKLNLMVALLVIAGLIGAPVAFATAISTPSIPIKASVSGTLTLTVNLYKGSATGPTGSILTEINFGTLQEKTFVVGGVTYKELRSDDAGGMGEVIAMITANSHSTAYTISQVGTALTSGSNTIPAGASVCVPAYATQDNGGVAKPAAAVVGTAGSWVGSRTIYTSEAAPAAMRTVQAHYAITGDSASGATTACPLNQPAGNYVGSTVITVTA